MDNILSPVKWQLALVYLYDVVVFLRSPHDLINHLKLFLSLLQDPRVNLKLKRSNFFAVTVGYRGHFI